MPYYIQKQVLVFFILFMPFIVAVPHSLGLKEKTVKSVRKIILTREELNWIGSEIFLKECNGKFKYLTSWNKGEQFASLGIGHFIWYPEGMEGPFKESFPELLSFVKKRGVRLPLWLDNLTEPDCPWRSRSDFLADHNSYKMNSLRRFLSETKHLQSLFILKRLQFALPKMLSASNPNSKQHLVKQFLRVANSSEKLYVLVDYVNFKGEGVLSTERYNNQGWGLLQVLSEMKGDERGISAILEFARSAELILKRRVINAPVHRKEQRWMPGWSNRIKSYKKFIQEDDSSS